MNGLSAIIDKLIDGYGLAGIVIAVLSLAVWKLFGHYKASQEGRIKDGREMVAAMERNTQAMNSLAEVIKDRR